MPKINREEHEILKSLAKKWKWIARDKKDPYETIYETLCSSQVMVYQTKPEKDDVLNIWFDCCPGGVYLPDDLFQFIRWEDDEPHEISELTREYEWSQLNEKYSPIKGSEEIEVKKDIEWLKERVYKMIPGHAEMYSHPDDITVLKTEILNTVIELIDQLVEQKVLSQELPVIPSFVAEWIEGNKQVEEKWNDYSNEDAMNDTIHFTIYNLFTDPTTNSHVELRKPVLKWLSFDRGNYFKLINAVRYDYEVAEEQKYFAKIKGHENISSDDKYWNYCITDESLDIGDNKVHADVLAEYVLSATKDEWENLGINDDNADFVLVEELEE